MPPSKFKKIAQTKGQSDKKQDEAAIRDYQDKDASAYQVEGGESTNPSASTASSRSKSDKKNEGTVYTEVSSFLD